MRILAVVLLSSLALVGCASTTPSSARRPQSYPALADSSTPPPAAPATRNGCDRSTAEKPLVRIVECKSSPAAQPGEPLIDGDPASAPPAVDEGPWVSVAFGLLNGDAGAVEQLAADLNLNTKGEVVITPEQSRSLEAGADLPAGVSRLCGPRFVSKDGQEALVSIGNLHDHGIEFSLMPHDLDSGEVRVEYQYHHWVGCNSAEWGAGNHWLARHEFIAPKGATVARLVRSPEHDLPVIIIVHLMTDDEMKAMTSN